jgi:hypothetical protein
MNDPLIDEITQLQKALSNIDMMFETRNSYQIPGFLVRALKDIRIRMDGNKNHRRPHIHIDYANSRHSASYAIDTGERLAGSMANQYDRQVRKWIDDCRPKLLELWQRVQAGERTDPIIAELRGNSP